MFITAYAQAAGPKAIQLWVGVFGTDAPPPPTFLIDQQPAQPVAPPVWHRIRDKHDSPKGRPLNHQGVFRFDRPDDAGGTFHRVDITVGQATYRLRTNTLPAEVPAELDGSFNVLICSCYFQPEDRQGLLGKIVSEIKLQPHLTLMAGDQVYVDLPLFEDLPEQEPELSQRIGDKYMRNWASTALQCAGLGEVLGRAPVVCLPDDHEFWNNYPFPQAQLPATWAPEGRDMLQTACLALYQDYQVGGGQPPSGAVRLDVHPLKMLFLDTRCERDDQFDVLMTPKAFDEVQRWADDLIAAKASGEPAVGVLASGQSLFIERPHLLNRRVVDAELGNYEQFQKVMAILEHLANQGVPVVYLTGDVHWGRVATGVDQQSNRTMLYEVISSPSCLIREPKHVYSDLRARLPGVFGPRDPWPRHGSPEPLPKGLGQGGRFKPASQFGRRGDQVAIVSFTRSGSGVNFKVTYYAITEDRALSKSETNGPYSLQVF